MAWRGSDSGLGRLVRMAAATLISLSALILACQPAQAHRFRHSHHYWHFGRYGHYHHYARYRGHGGAVMVSAPAFSAIVVDANNGRTLYAVSEDGLRYPASITKVMTLYLLFEQLDKGAVTLQTRIPISDHAAAQEPSKLGIEPGESISVDDAIKAIVTRSANDVAVAIAEAIGHDETNFAELMTRKARALGMSHTVYRNASGLPNDEQVTTARDLSILARAIEDRFPRYFHYFSTHEFEYAGEAIGNHNHLLGRVDGVDGIKTGYTRASGFNLLTSVHRGGRSLIAVVMGGRTAAARDRIMENLVADHIAAASTVRTATNVADASTGGGGSERAAPREALPVRPLLAVVAANVPTHMPAARAPRPQIEEGDDAAGDDDSPTLRVAAMDPVAKSGASEQRPLVAPPDERFPSGPKVSDRVEPKTRKIAEPRDADETSPAPPPKPRFGDPGANFGGKATTKTSESAAIDADAWARRDDQDPRPTYVGWMIQIGATDDPAKANALLSRARERNRSTLASAKPFTEKVQKGEDTLYRARFAGLDFTSAEIACRSLKRNGFSCFTTHD